MDNVREDFEERGIQFSIYTAQGKPRIEKFGKI